MTQAPIIESETTSMLSEPHLQNEIKIPKNSSTFRFFSLSSLMVLLLNKQMGLMIESLKKKVTRGEVRKRI
jgi:hypothetical protein